MISVSDLRYDAVAHQTTAPDGRDVPHVTHILESVGVATNFDVLAAQNQRMARDIEFAGLRGTAVHADCHAYDDDDLDWSTVDARVTAYVAAWVDCRTVMGLEPIAHARERQVFDPHNFYTGILDGVFMRLDGARYLRILLDIKTGDPDDAACHLQTAAYENAWLCGHPNEPIDERWAVQLRPGHRVPYRIINYTARPLAYQDTSKFLACLCTFNEQPGRRSQVR